MTQTSFDPRLDVVERIAFARRLFASDVAAMTPESLAANGGGESRCGFDLLLELTGFFDGFAQQLAQGPSPIEGFSGEWRRAPMEYHDKAAALDTWNAGADRLTQALLDYKGDFIADVFPSQVGPFTPLSIGNLAVWHIMYHSGQLNYIQTMFGDTAVHWGSEAS